jgi:DNA topoisomerase-2
LNFELNTHTMNTASHFTKTILKFRYSFLTSIKGLFINFVHFYWPQLIQLPFLEQFITPILKVTKDLEKWYFFSNQDFDAWKDKNPNHSTLTIKYYNGLHSSTFEDIDDYFVNIDRHRIVFKYGGIADDEAIEKAFGKDSEEKKALLSNYFDECKQLKLAGLPRITLYNESTKFINFHDFIYFDLVLYSLAHALRCIPNLIDGFKLGQRKVIFTCLKQNIKNDVNVSNLASSVAIMTACHYGEASLCNAVISLAQNHVGSNNINLLEPLGQLGTRFTGGKDNGQVHKIFTKINPLTRLLFNRDDEPLLTYQTERGQQIEPEYLIPIIPLVLVNGAYGFAMGWKSEIPKYSPRDIITNLRRMMRHEEPVPMKPWYRSFRGQINFDSVSGKGNSVGKLKVLDGAKVEIDELPIGVWSEKYKKEVLPKISCLKGYKEYCTHAKVRFVVEFDPEVFSKLKGDLSKFEHILKLSSSINSQFNLFDSNTILRSFQSTGEILKEFYKVRLDYYEKRKIIIWMEN